MRTTLKLWISYGSIVTVMVLLYKNIETSKTQVQIEEKFEEELVTDTPTEQVVTGIVKIENIDPPVLKFNRIYLAEQFEISSNNDDIELASFIQAYETLILLLNKLGPAFKFITKDITKKLNLLRSKRKQDIKNYTTLRKMIITEKSRNLINTVKKPDKNHHSGSRDFQLLQRAMKMLYLFLKKIIENETDDLGRIALEAYNESPLPEYHSWAIRQSIKVAVLALPKKKVFFEVIGADEMMSETELVHFQRAYKAMQKIYNKADEIYKEQNLLRLP